MYKVCTECNEEKSIKEFTKDSSKKDGLCCYCIKCKKTLSKKYYEENKEKLKRNSLENYHKNKDKYRQARTDYMRKRRRSNVKFRIIDNLRNRLYYTLKREYKDKTTKEFLGCTLNELKKHLKGQFEEGMSWDNYGEWHIDHIKPITSFDLSKQEQRNKCFHYSNLQPLWAEDNIRKSNKLITK